MSLSSTYTKLRVRFPVLQHIQLEYVPTPHAYFSHGTIHIPALYRAPFMAPFGMALLLHEVGHALWYLACARSPEIARAYHLTYGDPHVTSGAGDWLRSMLTVSMHEDFVSLYAQTCANEDAAETFRVYMARRLPRIMSPRLEKKVSLLERILELSQQPV